MSPVFVTAPFLVQKALKTANSEKFVFSCQTASVAPEPFRFACFRSKSGSRRSLWIVLQTLTLLDSAFSPENRQIPSPLSFGPKSAQKRPSSRVPEDFVLRKFESIMERVDSLMGNVGSLMPGRRWEGCRDSALTTETRLRSKSPSRSEFRLRFSSSEFQLRSKLPILPKKTLARAWRALRVHPQVLLDVLLNGNHADQRHGLTGF